MDHGLERSARNTARNVSSETGAVAQDDGYLIWIKGELVPEHAASVFDSGFVLGDRVRSEIRNLFDQASTSNPSCSTDLRQRHIREIPDSPVQPLGTKKICDAKTPDRRRGDMRRPGATLRRNAAPWNDV